MPEPPFAAGGGAFWELPDAAVEEDEEPGVLPAVVDEADEAVRVEPDAVDASPAFGFAAVADGDVEEDAEDAVEEVEDEAADDVPDLGTLPLDEEPNGFLSVEAVDDEAVDDDGFDAKELVDEAAFGSSFFSGLSGVLAATFSGFRSIVTGRFADVLADGLLADPAEPGFESLPEVVDPDVPEAEGEDVPLALSLSDAI